MANHMAAENEGVEGGRSSSGLIVS